MKIPSYYNTNFLTDGDLHSAQLKNLSQEDKTLLFFKAHPGRLITAERINNLVLPGCHRGTVSRVLRNLVLGNELEKTENFGTSKTSPKVHTWRLKTKTPGLSGEQIELF